MLIGFGLFSMAQTKFQVKNNVKEVKSIKIQSSDQVSDQSFALPYLKPVNHPNNGTDVINVYDIGEASNAYSLYDGGRTCVWVENDINSISFTHRMSNPPGGPGSGYIAYDFSTDGGATWLDNNQVYEAPTGLDNARYPQGLIYNPQGNTNPSNAFFTYFLPILDQTNGDSWGGYAWGGNFLTIIPPDPTQTNQPSTPSGGIFQSFPEAFHINPNGNTFVVEPSLIGGIFVNYTGELLFTNGEFNTGTNDYEYTQELFEAPITSIPAGCTISCTKIAFSPDGQTGYVALLTNNGENTQESYGCYYPVLYKSTDGGETWNDEAINVQLGGPDGLEAVLNYMSDETLAQIYETPIPPRDEIPFTTAYDMDLVVDAFGNPHILTTVGVGSQEWSIYTSATGEPCNGWIAMIHIYSTDDETWMCDTLGTPHTFRGEFGGAGGISEDNRPQISITPIGKKLFFSWIDTDQFGCTDNIYPDIFCVGYDVDYNVYTEEDGNYKVWNVTTMSAAWMSAYMATQSYYVFDNGDSWEIPFVYQEMDINDPFQPVQFKYIQDFVIVADDFGDVPENHFNFIGGNTSSPYWSLFLAEASINDVNMEGGDEIGIFDDNILVGVITLTQVCTPDNQFENTLLAFSSLEGGNQGYTPGNNISLKCWDASEQLEVSEFEIVFDDPYGDAWSESIFPEGNGQYSIPHINFINEGSPPILVSATPGIEEITLVWETIPDDNKTNHFNFEGGDPLSPEWTIYIGGATFDEINMEAGDEIGIFDGDLLVGAFTLDQVCTPDNQFENDFIAFRVLLSGSGYKADNAFSLIAWDESEGLESNNFEYTFSNPYGNAWTGDVFTTSDSQYSMAEFAFYGYIPSFNIYYEDGTLVAASVEGTTYTDIDLIAGQGYCYYITQIFENGLESAASNVLYAVPLFPPFGNIAGVVVNSETLEPIEGAQIVIEGTLFETTTYPDGTYLIENVDIGIYAVSANANNYVSETIFNQVLNGETSIVDFSLMPIITQVYDLVTGYQFVSTRAQHDNPDMINIVDNILDNLDFVRNTGGFMVRKIGPVWINSIGDWITTEGYLFKMNSEAQLSITGIPIDPQTPISLTTGYQIISYLPRQAINAIEACENILDNLDFVRNTGGFMLRKIGPVWVNSIGDLIPGEGYLVKMNSGDELIYPDLETKYTGISNTEPDFFKFEGGNAAEPVFTIYIEGLRIGDEVAVFDEERPVGASVVVSDNILENAIPVFSNLYEAGNKPIIKVWDKSENKEYVLSDYTFSNPYGDAWMEDVFPVEDGEYSLLHFSATGVSDENEVDQNILIYPNPSKGIFNISIEGVSGKVQIKVFDVHGNDYRFFEIEGKNNIITEKLDLKELATGVYFISFSGKDFSRVKKIVIQ